jgi:hypothetical protein
MVKALLERGAEVAETGTTVVTVSEGRMLTLI